jgi:hypothetical protein
MNTLSFLFSTLQRCFVAVLFFCGLPASAADTVRSTDIVAVELNHRFVISTPGICEQLSSDQYAEVELRIQGELTPLKPMDCNPAATGYGLQFFMPQLDGSDLGAMRELLVGSPWKDAKHGFRRDLPYSLTLNTAVGGGVLVSGMLRLQVLRPAYLLLASALFWVSALHCCASGVIRVYCGMSPISPYVVAVSACRGYRWHGGFLSSLLLICGCGWLEREYRPYRVRRWACLVSEVPRILPPPVWMRPSHLLIARVRDSGAIF